MTRRISPPVRWSGTSSSPVARGRGRPDFAVGVVRPGQARPPPPFAVWSQPTRQPVDHEGVENLYTRHGTGEEKGS